MEGPPVVPADRDQDDAGAFDPAIFTALVPRFIADAASLGTQVGAAVAVSTRETVRVVFHAPQPQPADTSPLLIIDNFCYGTLIGDGVSNFGPLVIKALRIVLIQVEAYYYRRFLDHHSTLVGNMMLTPREREVLYFMEMGHSPVEVAKILHISKETLRTHRKNLYAKLDAHRELEVVRHGKEAGLFLYLT